MGLRQLRSHFLEYKIRKRERSSLPFGRATRAFSIKTIVITMMKVPLLLLLLLPLLALAKHHAEDPSEERRQRKRQRVRRVNDLVPVVFTSVRVFVVCLGFKVICVSGWLTAELWRYTSSSFVSHYFATSLANP